MRAVNERDVATLGRVLAPLAETDRRRPALSPARSPATRAPSVSAARDRRHVIPSSESTALGALPHGSGNVRVEVLLTPLLSHADARAAVPPGDMWRLVRFWTRLWDGLER